MATRSNPIQDQVAIVGVGSAPYSRDSRRSLLDLGLEAAVNAIRDANVDRSQIDGICGTGLGLGIMVTHGPGVLSLQGALGIPSLSWSMNGWLGSHLVYAANAVYSGTCDYCLIVQAEHRITAYSQAASQDPFRLRASRFGVHSTVPNVHYSEGWIHGAESYAAFANRYMHDYGAPRETFGMFAVNNRQWASQNPAAVKRTPFTMDEYLEARMIRKPLGVLDMDLPVDGAEALVITTAERAKDLRPDPVFLHAMSLGQAPVAEFYENGNWGQQSPWKAFQHMWARSELQVDDVDLFYPYDGYTPISLALTEAAGFAPQGEGWRLVQDSWNSDEQKLALNGRTRVHTGGGSLSHGRTGGTNYYTEAVHQLRAEAGESRQVKDAKTALFGIGSFFHDPAAMLFRVD